MDGDPSLRPLLRRLDLDLRQAFADGEPVVLAFSAGLASLVLAALARKHGDVMCVVVGTRQAADVQAALVARSFLDYRVEVLSPTPTQILRAARAILAFQPRPDPADVVSLIPLALVEERHPENRVVSGFGLSPRPLAVGRYLAGARVRTPGLANARTRVVPRRKVLQVARTLALPDAFALAPRRVPAEGSGIGPSLRAMGHAQHTSVARLLRGLV